MERKTVLVYGSARKGSYNNYIIESGKFLGKTILKGYQLYSLGTYPAVSRKQNSETVVEVWDVTLNSFMFLDILEKRYDFIPVYEKVKLNGMEIEGIVYIQQNLDGYKEIESGDWFK